MEHWKFVTSTRSVSYTHLFRLYGIGRERKTNQFRIHLDDCRPSAAANALWRVTRRTAATPPEFAHRNPENSGWNEKERPFDVVFLGQR